jgi:hypothetical protein
MAKLLYTCPKCGGSDYFMSQRNTVSGIGIYQSAKLTALPVCRICNEIMSGTRDKEAEKAEAKKLRKYIGSSFLIVITVVVLWTLVAYLLGGI